MNLQTAQNFKIMKAPRKNAMYITVFKAHLLKITLSPIGATLIMASLFR